MLINDLKISVINLTTNDFVFLKEKILQHFSTYFILNFEPQYWVGVHGLYSLNTMLYENAWIVHKSALIVVLEKNFDFDI